MKVRRKGADDCCCNDWKNKIKELWEKYQDVVRGVKFGDNPVSWPDGDGIVQVDTEGLIDVDHTLNKNSINPVANAPVATAIESLEAKDIVLEGDIQDVQGDLEDIGSRIDGIDVEIDALGGRISTVDGKVDLQNSYNAATRAIANSAQQTAETFDDRLDSLEESDTIQDQQIAALQDADAENAKLAGDNAFTGNNSFSVNPKAAAPASGAVDTSVVNANWVSQTGAGKPNNLIHDTGLETLNNKIIESFRTRTFYFDVRGDGQTNYWRHVATVKAANKNGRMWGFVHYNQSDRFMFLEIRFTSQSPINVFIKKSIAADSVAVNFDNDGNYYIMLRTPYLYQTPAIMPLILQNNDGIAPTMWENVSGNSYASADDFPLANTSFGTFLGVDNS